MKALVWRRYGAGQPVCHAEGHPMNRHWKPFFPGSMTRRELLKQTAVGFGWLAFLDLLATRTHAADPLAPRSPHFTPKAKRVLFLFMHGGPSQVDTFDYK